MENIAAKTAYGPVFQVALEQLVVEKERIVRDSVAYQIMPAYLKALIQLCRIGFVRKLLLDLMDRVVPGTRGGILCRKRYVTEKLNDALEAGFQSIVVLGAGFDTLAYRVSGLASRQVYEVDLQQIIQSKREAIQRIFGRVPVYIQLVPVDFNSQDLEVELQQAGYSQVQPAFFIWEGVTQYISEKAVRRIFEFLKKAPPGSQLVFTYIRQDFIDGEQLYGLKTMYHQTRVAKQLWQFGLDPSAIGAFLRHYGWEELEQVGSAEYQQRYLEPVNRTQLVMEIERAVCAQKQDCFPPNPLRDPPVV
jgi:methyltransferase (TIGR00027 family)